jgi:hypothetical protein
MKKITYYKKCKIERFPVVCADKQYFLNKNEIQYCKCSNSKELWLTMSDGANGAVAVIGKNNSLHLDICLDSSRNDIPGIFAQYFEKITEIAPERLILPYDYVTDWWLMMVIEIFKVLWANRAKSNFQLLMYVPTKQYISEISATEKFTTKKYKPIVWDPQCDKTLGSWQEYLNQNPHITIPLWNWGAKKFDFFEFYDFCCKRLAYIEKRRYLFPLLESGMCEENLKNWEVCSDKTFIFKFYRYRCESIIAADSLRMWKLLDESKLQRLIYLIDGVNMFRSDITSSLMLPLEEEDAGVDLTIPKNKLALDIFKTGKGNHFLFPMPLFLGYYAVSGEIECFIPEYNFHELLDALCKVLKNEPCPELFPDIPDEPGIFLDAYRNGYIKFFPRCKKYYENGDHVEAEFINSDEAEEFVYKFEENYSANPGESILIYGDGKIVCKNIDRNQLLPALEKAATDCPEYKINMRLWDGNTLREMTVEEIICDSAERIVRYFGNDNRKALEYLQKLSKKYRGKYQRHTIVR